MLSLSKPMTPGNTAATKNEKGYIVLFNGPDHVLWSSLELRGFFNLAGREAGRHMYGDCHFAKCGTSLLAMTFLASPKEKPGAVIKPLVENPSRRPDFGALSSSVQPTYRPDNYPFRRRGRESDFLKKKPDSRWPSRGPKLALDIKRIDRQGSRPYQKHGCQGPG